MPCQQHGGLFASRSHRPVGPRERVQCMPAALGACITEPPTGCRLALLPICANRPCLPLQFSTLQWTQTRCRRPTSAARCARRPAATCTETGAAEDGLLPRAIVAATPTWLCDAALERARGIAVLQQKLLHGRAGSSGSHPAAGRHPVVAVHAAGLQGCQRPPSSLKSLL